jgi:HD superfamily phosphodiesterase
MSIDSEKRRRLRLVAVAFVVPALMIGMWVAIVTLADFDAYVALALIVLGGLAVLATNLDVEVVSRVAVSGIVMIFTASLVVFNGYGYVLGPAVVGALGALTIDHIRRREYYKIAINAGADALALLAASWTFSQFGFGAHQLPTLLAAVIVSTLVYSLVNSVLVAVPVSIDLECSYLGVLKEFKRFLLGSLLFSFLGLGVGWVYLEFGPAVVPLLVVPILIAKGTFASYLELRASQEQTIETLILALEAKDQYTSGHARRVAKFAEYVGEELGFGPRRMERLRYAALMHDIGKLIVPNQLLNKPGRLTEAEFERVKRHEPVSVELLRRIDFLAPIAGDTTTEAATAAVTGDADLVEPAIIHVADAFDAMTSTRSYRRALSPETAFAELRSGAGTQFNAQCVDALIGAIEHRGELYGDGHEVDEHDWAVAPPESGTGSAGLGDLVEEQVPEEQAAGK